MTHDEEVETVFLEFESELSVGEVVFLLDYTGTLNDQLRGFYRSKYTINGEERFLAVTLFEVCLCLVCTPSVIIGKRKKKNIYIYVAHWFHAQY